jgi:hypothetical protein
VPFTSPTAALRHLKVAEQDSSLDQYNGLLAGLIGREPDLENQAEAKYTYLYFVTNVVRLDGAPNIDIDSLYNESVDQAEKFRKKILGWIKPLCPAQDPLSRARPCRARPLQRRALERR